MHLAVLDDQPAVSVRQHDVDRVGGREVIVGCRLRAAPVRSVGLAPFVALGKFPT